VVTHLAQITDTQQMGTRPAKRLISAALIESKTRSAFVSGPLPASGDLDSCTRGQGAFPTLERASSLQGNAALLHSGVFRWTTVARATVWSPDISTEESSARERQTCLFDLNDY
jgi:hypothetical protein